MGIMQNKGFVYALLVIIVLMSAVIVVQSEQIQKKEISVGFTALSNNEIIVQQSFQLTKEGSLEIIPNVPIKGHDIDHYTITVNR
jgi:hypothetical protein